MIIMKSENATLKVNIIQSAIMVLFIVMLVLIKG